MSAIDDLGSQRYISLTTYRQAGTAVATPVWQVHEGDHLYVLTDAASGKAKRLANSPRVMVTACDMRGRVKGTAHEGRARLLDAAGTARVRRQIEQKYGLMAKVLGWGERLRRRSTPSEQVGIEITLD